MADELYFQWQNDVLRKSIYPLREMKLRDFLVYFREIELCKDYENKDISGEVDDYRRKKKLAVEKAVKSYFDFQEYFKRLDVSADYDEYLKKNKAVGEEALDAIQKFHKVFHDYLDSYKDKPRHETYFVSQRVLYWLGYRKEYVKKIAIRQRRLDAMKLGNPSAANLPDMEKELADMKDCALKMIDVELERLYAFVAASGKIEKRKLDLMKAVDEAEKIKTNAERELAKLRSKIEAQDDLQRRDLDGLARLKSPPELGSVEPYFSAPDVSAQLRNAFPQASAALLEVIGGFRKEMQFLLRSSKSDMTSLKVIQNTLDNLSLYRKEVQKAILKLETDLKNMGEKWAHKADRETERNNLRDVSLKVVDEELNKLADYYTAFAHSKKSTTEWNELIKAKAEELDSVNRTILKLGGDAKAWREQIDQCDEVLILHEDKRLAEYVPDLNQPVTPKDIVQAKADEYKLSLMDLDHYELLKLVVDKFKAKPERYPRWLQYMVVHFSGMRYASAHGSWADPRDLLSNLRASKIEVEMKDETDGNLDTLCREKLDYYEPSDDTPLFTDEQKPKLASATDDKWKEKIAEHVKDIKRALEMTSSYHQRQALINLRIDEGSYEIDQMPSAGVFEELMTYKDVLPDWMWKEIVRLTDLRVTEVKDENWEKSSQGQSGSYTKQDMEFRTMLEDWKKKFLTGWREEHDRSDELVVSRAVCNEVAEHIQHLRGLKPPGGLTAKPTWYQSTEKTNPNSYFVKPVNEDDLKPGASILWLRFVRKEPNEWQMAHPIATKRDKYELLPPGFQGKGQVSPDGSTSWAYDLGDPIKRWRTAIAVDGGKVRQEEWLRWMHEATVVETAKTADGKIIVLTFETALPGDDPRLSTIGVFKRHLSDLTDDGQEDTYHRSFIGYIPEEQLPEENLKNMLDWDKILYKPVQEIVASNVS